MSAHLLLWTAGAGAGFVAGVMVLRARGVLRLSTVIALGWAWEGLFLGAKWQFRLEHYPLPAALWMGDALAVGVSLFSGPVPAEPARLAVGHHGRGRRLDPHLLRSGRKCGERPGWGVP